MVFHDVLEVPSGVVLQTVQTETPTFLHVEIRTSFVVFSAKDITLSSVRDVFRKGDLLIDGQIEIQISVPQPAFLGLGLRN